MLALRKTAPVFGASLQEVEEPRHPLPDEVLVEVAAVGICGSDLHVYEWGESYEFMCERLPVTLGHEFSGRIVATGAEVVGPTVGERVAIVPSTSCMKCEDCLAGYPQRCMRRSTVGLTRDGAFARYVRVPAVSCIGLPEHIDMSLAALMEPLSVGDNAAHIGGVSMGDTVVVLGPGTIGQAIARCARWRGASQVIVVGKGDRARLQTALQVGATHTIDLDETADLRAAIEADVRALARFRTLGRVNLFALAFRTNNMKTAAGRARKIVELVSMLARDETIVPERARDEAAPRKARAKPPAAPVTTRPARKTTRRARQ